MIFFFIWLVSGCLLALAVAQVNIEHLLEEEEKIPESEEYYLLCSLIFNVCTGLLTQKILLY